MSKNSNIANGTILKLVSVLSKKNIHITCQSINCYQSTNTIEINGIFGWHNNFKHNEEVLLYIVLPSNVIYADSVTLVPLTNDEWELVNSHSVLIQDNFLHQVCSMQVDGVYPFWCDRTCILLRVESFDPLQTWSVITSNSILNIIPNSAKASEDISNFSKESLTQYSKQYSQETSAKHSSASQSIARTLKTLFDFFHFLLTGRTLKQKRIQTDIYTQWSNDLNPNIVGNSDRSVIGRCFRSTSCNDNNATLNCLTDPVIAIAPEGTHPHLTKLVLGVFEKIPFTSKKSTDTNVPTFTCFVQFRYDSNKVDRSVEFIFPDSVWVEIGLQIGDRALCRICDYEHIFAKELTLEIPMKIDNPVSQEIRNGFLIGVDQINDDFVPLLMRQNMKIPISYKDNKVMINLTFKTSAKSNILKSYSLTSRYFLTNGITNIAVESNMSSETQFKVTDSNEEHLNLNQWIANDSLARLLIPYFDRDQHCSCNIMMYGPSGIGKSFFCKKICQLLLHNEDYQYYSINIDCRDLIGLQVDSLRQKLASIVHECCWRSPSLVCFDNLDSLTTITVSDDTTNNTTQSSQISSIAFTFKYFYESILRINSLCQLVTITTCNDINRLPQEIIGVPAQKSVIFEKIIDMTEHNKNTFLSVVDKYCERWTTVGIFEKEKRGDTVHWLESESKPMKNIYGSEAINILKNVSISATNRTIERGSDQSVMIEQNDFQEAFKNQMLISSRKNIRTKLRFSDLYGLGDVKKQLTEMFVWPSKFPKIFKKSPIKLQQGLLLYGLPGCGKSQVALALANEVDMNFIMVKGPELLSKYIGASEEQVRNLFNEARRTQPTLIFFDEFDSLAPRRGHDSTGVTDRVVNQLLTEIDGVSGTNNAGIFVLAASNRPELIDPAILRPGRISGRAFCRAPIDTSERVAALEYLLRRSGIDVATESPSTIWDYLTEQKTDPHWLDLYSYADLVGIVNVTENISVIRFDDSDDAKECSMTLDDFQSAILKSRASLTREQISDYIKAFVSFDSCRALEFISNTKVTLA